MKKKFIVGVATSSVTWTNLKKFCFNQNFMNNRQHFDLAVVLNGENIEAELYIKNIGPDYFYVRPNTGIDSAAFDFFIKRIPVYDHYILLHDDHWFKDDHWIDTFNKLLKKHDPDYTVWGNIYEIPKEVLEDGQKFRHISEVMGYKDFQISDYNYFIQGYAGLYSRLAVNNILKIDGIPHIHGNNRKTTQILERLFSFMLIDMGFKLKQIPPGFEQYLVHNTWSEENLLRKLAGKYFENGSHEKAIETLQQVVNNYHTTKYDHMNLGTIHLKLNQIDETVKHFKKALEMDPELAYAKKVLTDLKAFHKI